MVCMPVVCMAAACTHTTHVVSPRDGRAELRAGAGGSVMSCGRSVGAPGGGTRGGLRSVAAAAAAMLAAPAPKISSFPRLAGASQAACPRGHVDAFAAPRTAPSPAHSSMPITASEGSAKFSALRDQLDDTIKRRFFYRQAFEIYGGTAGFYT